MGLFSNHQHRLIWKSNRQILEIQAWGQDSLRIRATLNKDFFDDVPHALEEIGEDAQHVSSRIEISEGLSSLTNGNIRAEVARDGSITFFRSEDNRILLREIEPLGVPVNNPLRKLRPVSGGLTKVAQHFVTDDDEKIYGLGQQLNGYLDQKGMTIDLTQQNSAVSVPFYVSSRGYGFLWNNPGIGRVELGKNRIRWVAEGCYQEDYWITASDAPAEIVSRYFEATGKPPVFPGWASGFWQCRLRYSSQEQLLGIARRYYEMQVPVSVIVIDYFAWSQHGEFRFDEAAFPDVEGMVEELAGMGMEVMVSIWPSIHPNSGNFDVMKEQGFLLDTINGLPANQIFSENNMRQGDPAKMYLTYYDATHPEAQKFVWDNVRKHYYDRGIHIFWLDANEPECYPDEKSDLVFHEGMGSAVANVYPLEHEKAFYEGMKAAGQREILNLCRSAWAGSQKYGAAVWSGDVPSTFQSLKEHIPAGLNMGMSGIPWWTHDIGGFHRGNIDDPEFRELVVRWFQFGAFSPIFRLHGCREAEGFVSHPVTGGAENEIWSFGEEACNIMQQYIKMREQFRPYIHQHMKACSEQGALLMRPLFYEFPEDERTYSDQRSFMFGPDYLVSPVTHYRAREWLVYLPANETWTDAWTGQEFEGGQQIIVQAPLEQVPLFVRGQAVNLLSALQ